MHQRRTRLTCTPVARHIERDDLDEEVRSPRGRTVAGRLAPARAGDLYGHEYAVDAMLAATGPEGLTTRATVARI